MIPAVLFFFTLFFYLRTHCASFNINDSGETIMVCDLLTISHSPGYPLHTLWGRVNCLLPLGQPMLRLTFCSMLTAAAAVVVVYFILQMLFKGIFNPAEGAESSSLEPKPGAWLWEIPAVFGALTFAFSYQQWFQACGAKGGIYTLNTLLAVSMLFLFFKMRDKSWFVKSFLLMGFLFGLSLAHHWPNLAVMAPAYLWLLLIHQNKIPFIDICLWFCRPVVIYPSLGAFFLLLLISFFAFGPSDAVLNSGATALFILAIAIVVKMFDWLFLLASVAVFFFATVLVWIMTGTPSLIVPAGAMVIFIVSAILLRIFGLKNYILSIVTTLLSVSIYSYLPIRATQHPLVNWWNPQTLNRLVGTVLREGYKGVGDVRSWATKVRVLKRFWLHAHHQFGDVFTFVLVAMAIWGFVWLWNKKQWPAAMGLFFFGFGVFMGILLFNNPLEGYQWTIDNFFTPVFLTICMFAAAGIAGICQWVSKEWPYPRVPLYTGAFCLSFALMPLMLNYKSNDQSRYVSSYDEGINMLKTVNDDAVILCNGDIDILPLWYLQFVEGKRPKVATFTMQLIPYEWYRDPLFERFPYLKVPVGQDIRPETVVQNMIETHLNDRSFYFTNIFTAPWMREKNPALPEGFLWRMIKSKNLNYNFTSNQLNTFWSTYRLRYMDEPDRGYWDEYTDVMKDSYGIGFDFTGYFALMNKMPDIARWSFSNALKYRQIQTLVRIYMMLGESYLALGDTASAINNYQETLRRDPRNAYIYAKMGDAFFASKDFQDSESSYRTSLSINPQQTEASNGLLVLTNPAEGIRRFEESLKKEAKNSPQIPYLYGKLGDAYFMSKKYPAAKKAYQESLALNSSQPEAVNGLRLIKDGNF